MFLTAPVLGSTAMALLVAAGLIAGEPSAAPAPAPLVFRLAHPERQLAALLRLFEGSPAPHPAAALAAWKRASREPGRLGKPTEAVISFFNPEMVREWQSFHDARLELGLDLEGRVRWRLAVPHDDGTLGAMVTALRLSADRPPPLPAIEPLGRGDAVARRTHSGLVLASSPAELDRPSRGGEDLAMPAFGLAFRLDPRRLTTPAGPVPLRRAVELARGLGCVRIDGRMALEADRLGLEVDSALDDPPAGAGAIEESWLSWIPAERAATVVSLATGRTPAAWDQAFALADRIDRADPARAELAPLRVRLNLLAAASGTRLEADLWPHLRGLTLAVLVDPDRPGVAGPVIVCLHLDGEAAARRVVEDMLPRLAALGEGRRLPASGTGPPGPARDPAGPRRLGRLSGRPLEAIARGTTVVVGWGDGAIAALRSTERPAPDARRWLSGEGPAESPRRPSRVGVFWPGRLSLPVAGLDGPSPLAASLGAGPPIVWRGWSDGDTARDRVEWGGLGGLVRRFLASIPPASRQRP